MLPQGQSPDEGGLSAELTEGVEAHLSIRLGGNPLRLGAYSRRSTSPYPRASALGRNENDTSVIFID